VLQRRAAKLLAQADATLAGLREILPSSASSAAREAAGSKMLARAAVVSVKSATWSCVSPSYRVPWPLPLLVPQAHAVVLSELGRVLMRIRAARSILRVVWQQQQRRRIGYRAGGVRYSKRDRDAGGKLETGAGPADGKKEKERDRRSTSPRAGSSRYRSFRGISVPVPAPFTVLDVEQEETSEAALERLAAGSERRGAEGRGGRVKGRADESEDEDEDEDEDTVLLHRRVVMAARARRQVGGWRHAVSLASWQLQHGLGSVEDFLQVDVVQAETDRLMNRIAQAGAGGGSSALGRGAASHSGGGIEGGGPGSGSGSTGFADLQDAHADYVSRLVLRSGLARGGVADKVEGLVRCAEQLASIAAAADDEVGVVIGGKALAGIVTRGPGASGHPSAKSGRCRWREVNGYIAGVEKAGVSMRQLETSIREGEIAREVVEDVRRRGRNLARGLLSEAYGQAGVGGGRGGDDGGAGSGSQVYALSSGASLAAVEVRLNGNGWLDDTA